MRLSDLVTFRRDLLFQGAVQIGWFETDPPKCRKAAENFVFHGPAYHGVSDLDFGAASAYRLKDTASFTLHILSNLMHADMDHSPITIAAAGYGTGKSHLGLTLSTLLAKPQNASAKRIIANLKAADLRIGAQVEDLLGSLEAPYLVLPINGMQDFDLVEEIRRQVLASLARKGIDTAPLEELRPRFRVARNFTSSFFNALWGDFAERFGQGCTLDKVLQRLAAQDEEAFRFVGEIYEQKMGDPIRAAGQESLQRFLAVLRQHYCGPEKTFSGLMIIFDEFGRYLEFAVQKPHIAGRDGLQQLFEGVQDNSESMSLLCLVQSELKAYVSRVAPELRDSLDRFISRYDSAPKVRLSTNLETIIASLLQKNDPQSLDQVLALRGRSEDTAWLMTKLRKWFPEMENHALWKDPERFAQVIQKGCWPLHPASTWLLYHLSSVGKSFQQRSAMSFLEAAITTNENREANGDYWSISPAELCNDYMVTEFLNSERYGQQGSVAHAYQNAVDRYKHELTHPEKVTLKAIVLAAKMGLRAASEKECTEALAMLAGLSTPALQSTLKKLSKEYGVLEWNESTRQYEIVGDAVPRRTFERFLKEHVHQIDANQRAVLFAQNMKRWRDCNVIETDFGHENQITTPEWHYSITYSHVQLIEGHIEFALRDWRDCIAVDKHRGKAIYCYIGPESDLNKVRETVRLAMHKGTDTIGLSSRTGAPLVVIMLCDEDGRLGESIAELWVLNEHAEEADFKPFSNFIPDQRDTVQKELLERFGKLERKRDVVCACEQDISTGRLKNILYNVFSAVYPDRIPFPFDGFHTARGNAATDCQQLTMELFKGSLNQTTIAAYPSRQKNRAIAVLQESWKILSRDGTVARRPANPRIATIINLLEAMLTDGGLLNLGQAVRVLCSPPFGCNIASAGLLLGVFVSPRKEELKFLYRAKTISIENWLGNAFQKAFLDMAVLDETEVERIRPEQADEWQRLLDQWESEPTYEAQIEFREKAQTLSKELPVPQGLFYRYELLRQKTQTAQKSVNQWRKDLTVQEGFFKAAYEEKNAGKLARCACELLKLGQRMDANAEAWTTEQRAVVEDALVEVRQAAIQFFPAWLPRQVVLKPKDFGSFEHHMKNSALNFKKLSLQELAEQVEDQLRSVSNQVELLQLIETVIDQVDAFVAARRITQATKVNEIKDCVAGIEELEKKLRQALQSNIPISKANNRMDTLRRLKETCNEQLKAHMQRAESIWNTELCSIQDAREIAQEIRAIMTIFDGREEDLNDFRLMIQVLGKLDEHYQNMCSMAITDAELDKRYAKALEEANAILSEDDEIPWDIEETLRNFRREIEQARRDNAADWMAANVPSIPSIQTLDAAEVYRVRDLLRSSPPCLNQQQREQVSATIEACSQRLKELAVEGLIVQFKGLARDAQVEFLERAQTLLYGTPSAARSRG